MSPQDQDLRSTLHRLADATEPLPVDDDLWSRAQAAHRRGRVVLAAAVVTVIVVLGGAVTLWQSPDREARTATAEVPQGAIPSRIDDPGELARETEPALDRASVAFVSAAGQYVVVDAVDGSYHALDLPDGPTDPTHLALSPDGRRLAWASVGRIHVKTFGEPGDAFFPPNDQHADVRTLTWAPDSDQLLWSGTDPEGGASRGVLPASDSPAGGILRPAAALGIPSPSGDSVAVASTGTTDAAPFLGPRGKQVPRALPTDLYPSGASVRPLGWSQDHLAVAELDAPTGSYVEGRHVVLMTSPDEPESQWTFRVLLRDVPPSPSGLSLAVDLLPDLDGTSSQVLTHDFGGTRTDGTTIDNPLALFGVEVVVAIGFGIALAVVALMALRLLWRRLRG